MMNYNILGYIIQKTQYMFEIVQKIITIVVVLPLSKVLQFFISVFIINDVTNNKIWQGLLQKTKKKQKNTKTIM